MTTLAFVACLFLGADDVAPLPLVFEERFEKGAERWQPSDAQAWKIVTVDEKSIYSQFKQSKIKTPHRSPFNFSLVKDLKVTDFELNAKVRSTVKDYNHRDVCLFFGYQDPAHHYYVHLAKKADDHANQIFIVNGADRKKISIKSTEGTNWDDNWHQVKIIRKAEKGTIDVYFDDMKSPVMTAQDNTFAWGQVGVGSFDDTSDWTDIQVRGVLRKE